MNSVVLILLRLQPSERTRIVNNHSSAFAWSLFHASSRSFLHPCAAHWSSLLRYAAPYCPLPRWFLLTADLCSVSPAFHWIRQHFHCWRRSPILHSCVDWYSQLTRSSTLTTPSQSYHQNACLRVVRQVSDFSLDKVSRGMSLFRFWIVYSSGIFSCNAFSTLRKRITRIHKSPSSYYSLPAFIPRISFPKFWDIRRCDRLWIVDVRCQSIRWPVPSNSLPKICFCIFTISLLYSHHWATHRSASGWIV